MRFKLDENLGRRCQGLFRAAGHDAQTVLEESLSGATDRQIYDACRSERLCQRLVAQRVVSTFAVTGSGFRWAGPGRAVR
jgi:hypothetical protein